MSTAVFLKLLADGWFYLSFALYFGSYFGATERAIYAIPVLALGAALAGALAARGRGGLRWAGLLPLAALPLLRLSLADGAVLLPV